MSIKDTLLAEYDREMGTTRRLLERLPEDKLSWKPHQKSMSLGGLATHLANLPNWGGNILNETSFDLATMPPNRQEETSRAAILRIFDESSRRTRGWMDKTDGEYACMWTLQRGDPGNPGSSGQRSKCREASCTSRLAASPLAFWSLWFSAASVILGPPARAGV